MIRVSIGVLVCPQRGVLLLRTAKDKALYSAGTWEAPGGSLDEKEYPDQAMRREVFEETGYVISGTRWNDPPLMGTMIWRDISMCFYAIAVPSDWQPVLSDEHDGWCWYRPDTGYVIGDKGIPPWDFHDRLAPPDLSFIWAGWRLLGGEK